MAFIWRRLTRTCTRTKYKFSFTLQELQLTTDDTWKPENLAISFVHRRRKITSNERRWEESYSDEAKCVLIWPEQMAEEIAFETNLYCSNSDNQYDDKDWMIIVEAVSDKGKRKPIAAVPLNVRLFARNRPDLKSELKLKLRPLVPMLKQCSLIMLLGSSIVIEHDPKSIFDTTLPNIQKAEWPTNQTDATAPNRRETRNQIEKGTTEIQECSTDDAKKPKNIVEKTEVVFEEREVAPPPVPAHRKSEEENEPAGKVRPLWRVSAEEDKLTTTNRQSRTSRGSTEERTSTTAVFEVDSNSRAVPVPFSSINVPTSINNTNNTVVGNKSTTTHLNSGSLPRPRSHSPRAPSREVAPQPIIGETLLSWCQRVTDGYSSVKIGDFTKSWRNGLALCAIFHTYRPELIGEYGALDFSDRVDGRKANIKKALTAAKLIGLSDVPDESDLLTPDKKLIELLLQRLRRIFEGNFDDATPTSSSDHRISKLFEMSETEQKVVDMINKIRDEEDLENAVDYRNVEDYPLLAEGLKTPQGLNRDEDDDAETSNLNFGRNNVSITMVTPGFTNIRASGRQASPSKRDQLRQRARDLLEKTSTLPSSTPTSSGTGDNDKLREQARKILEEASVDGNAFKMSSSRAINSSSTPQSSFNRNTKINGSATDLRRVELVRPSVDVHRFKKRDPSPTLVRKQYDPNDTPILPAIGRSINNGSRTRMDELVSPSTFDRVKRYGSMRSAELKESLQVLAKQYGYGNVSASQEYLATPTKKFSSQWEKDVDDVEGTALEQEKIEQRISDVEEQSKAIKEKIADTEKGSSEEQMLLETFIRLTNEKNMLVGRQEYYNIIENIRQTTHQIDDYAHKLDELTKNSDDYQKSSDEKRATDDLMDNYRKALDVKSMLVQKLFAQEEEIQEDEERLNNLTLERASRFVRGTDQPVSASKRLMQWWRR